jgi:hypothetical protein
MTSCAHGKRSKALAGASSPSNNADRVHMVVMDVTSVVTRKEKT